MAKETPTEVLRRALKHFTKALSSDDLAVILGAIVERQNELDETIWRHLRAVSLFVGIREEIYIAGQRYSKGAMVRSGDDLFIAKASTSAPLTDSADWLCFASMPGAPPPVAPERKRKKVRVTAHDSRGRIAEFEEIWESAND